MDSISKLIIERSQSRVSYTGNRTVFSWSGTRKKTYNGKKKKRPILLSHIVDHPSMETFVFSSDDWFPALRPYKSLWKVRKKRKRKERRENKDVNGCKHSLFEFILAYTRGVVFCLAWKKKSSIDFFRSKRARENKIRVVIIIIV